MFSPECHAHSQVTGYRRSAHSIILFLLLFGFAGCRHETERRFFISQAEVISVAPPHKLIIIKHGEIPGFMPAMTMSYMVAKRKEAEGLGRVIRSRLNLLSSRALATLKKSS